MGFQIFIVIAAKVSPLAENLFELVFLFSRIRERRRKQIKQRCVFHEVFHTFREFREMFIQPSQTKTAELVFVCVIRTAWDLEVALDVRAQHRAEKRRRKALPSRLHFTRAIKSQPVTIDRSKIVSRVVSPELSRRFVQQVATQGTAR